MTSTINLDDVEAASRRLLESRMDSVRALAAARGQVAMKQEELREAETTDRAAYDTALRAGWTAEEIKKVGLAPVGVKRARAASPRRPRSTGVVLSTETAQATVESS